MTLWERWNALSPNVVIAIGTVAGLAFAAGVRRLEMKLERDIESAIMLAEVEQVLHNMGEYHAQGNDVVALVREWREYMLDDDEEDEDSGG